MAGKCRRLGGGGQERKDSYLVQLGVDGAGGTITRGNLQNHEGEDGDNARIVELSCLQKCSGTESRLEAEQLR